MRNSIQIREEENLEAMVEYAAAAGFGEVALSFGSGEMCFKDDFEERAVYIRELLDAHGLVCKQTHLPFYHLLVSSEEEKDEVEKAIENAFKASAILGAEWAAYHPRSAVNSGYDRRKSFADNQRVLTKYLAFAEKNKVGIAVENMPLYPYSSPQWRFFGGGWEELVDLVDGFKSDKMGICWDFGHAHTAGIDQPVALRAIGDRLKITHVHDNYKMGDHHQLPALASTEWGSIKWENVMPALKDIGYSGPLALELIFPPMPMLKSFVFCCKDCLDYLQTLSQ